MADLRAALLALADTLVDLADALPEPEPTTMSEVRRLFFRQHERPRTGGDCGDRPPITPVRLVDLEELRAEYPEPRPRKGRRRDAKEEARSAAGAPPYPSGAAAGDGGTAAGLHSGRRTQARAGISVRAHPPDGRVNRSTAAPEGLVAQAVAGGDLDHRRPNGGRSYGKGQPKVHHMSTWGAEWLLRRREAGETRDPGTDESRWNTHVVLSAFGCRELREIDRASVRDWLRELRKEDGSKLARMTRQSCLQLVRGALSDAVERGLIPSNPADGIRLGREGRTDDLWTYANPEEQLGLVLAAPADLRPLLGFAMGTGMRAGELCALRWADCQLDGPKPHAVVRYGSPPDVPTKGKRVRRVPLFGLGLAALNAQARDCAAGSPLVFPVLGSIGSDHRDPDHVIPWRVWKGTLSRAGITRRFRFHDLRHTCASSLISGLWGRRWSLEEVQAMLGHSSRSTTERYAHLAGTVLERAAAESA